MKSRWLAKQETQRTIYEIVLNKALKKNVNFIQKEVENSCIMLLHFNCENDKLRMLVSPLKMKTKTGQALFLNATLSMRAQSILSNSCS